MALEPKTQVEVQHYEVDGDEERRERKQSVPFAAPTHAGKSPFASLRWWIVEIAAAALSVVLLFVLVVILQKYNGYATANIDLPRHFTLNAIISLLSTFMKALLMVPVGAAIAQELWIYFASEAQKENCSSRLKDVNIFDSASRGTLGAVQLLWRFKGRRTVASLGAFITLGSLAFSTFTQNLVSYGNPTVIDKASPLAPMDLPSTSYWFNYVGSPAEGASSVHPSLDFIYAFYEGVFSGGITPIPGLCPSGNCTWDTTSSLGFGGGCVPTTVQSVHCFDTCVNVTTADPDTSNTCPPPEPITCNYTLASGSVATLGNFSNPDVQAFGHAPGFVVLTGTNGSFYSFQANERLYVANFDLFGAPYDSYSSDNWTPSGYECALWINVQSVNATTKASNYSQTLVSTTDLKGANFTSALDGSGNVTFPQIPPNLNPTREAFNVDATTTVALNYWLTTNLNGSITLDLATQEASSVITSVIWSNMQRIDAWIDNLALAMTNAVRSESTMTAKESATGLQLGVKVRWVWIAYPAALIGLSIILLAAVIVRTMASPVQAWKGSPLTFLLLDVDAHVRSTAFSASSVAGGMEAAAGNTVVRLHDVSHRNWEFKECVDTGLNNLE